MPLQLGHLSTVPLLPLVHLALLALLARRLPTAASMPRFEFLAAVACSLTMRRARDLCLVRGFSSRRRL